MSTSHHGDPSRQHDAEMMRRQRETMERLMGQLEGTARREYPQGRMGAHDDGALSYAVAADKQHGTVIIRFGKPVEWIGLGPAEVNQLINLLMAKMHDLGHMVTVETR